MSIRRGMVVAVAALAGALPWVMPAALQAQQTRGEQPMSVKLLPPSPETNQPLRFVMNEPGYVAAFIISPGEGVRLIYPLTNQEKLQWAGFHTESLLGLHFDDDAYDVVYGRSMYSAASFGVGYAQGPQYLYIVASRFPLDVSRFVHRPSALQRTVGYENTRSFYSHDAVNGLLNNVVSLGSDESWDTDVYMLWAPSWMDGAPHSFQDAVDWNLGTRVVICRDGSNQIVPLNWIFGGCYGDSRLLLSRPVVGGTSQHIASNADAPTVLPTIRGVRMRGMPSAKSEPVVSGFLTTAAGGVTDDGVRVVDRADRPERAITYTTVGGEPTVFVGRAESLREREDGDRDAWRERRGERHGERRLDDTPRLAPAPRLAPDPVLSPAPHLAPAPRIAPAPNVGSPRMSTPSMPHAAPRMEAPRMSSPAMAAPRTAPPASAPAAPPTQTSRVQ